VPAVVTKELSKYAGVMSRFRFHITSTSLINPENAPDEFEQSDVFRLRKHETGAVEMQRQAHLSDLTPEWVEEARKRMADWSPLDA
jgi:hypothetical protein